MKKNKVAISVQLGRYAQRPGIDGNSSRLGRQRTSARLRPGAARVVRSKR